MKGSKRVRIVVGAVAAIVVIAASSVGVGRLVTEPRPGRGHGMRNNPLLR